MSWIPLVSSCAGLVALALAFFGLPQIPRRREVARLRATCRSQGRLALSFDDGPHTVLTPRLLTLLESRGWRASFFVKGPVDVARAEILDGMERAGHLIGGHSLAHLHAWKTLPPRALMDAWAGFREFARWLPRDGFFRPPYGKIDLATWSWLRARGAKVSWWTIDSGDTWPTLPPVDETLARIRAEGGGVLLMHDGHEDPGRQDYVLELTERLLAEGEYVCCTIDELDPRRVEGGAQPVGRESA